MGLFFKSTSSPNAIESAIQIALDTEIITDRNLAAEKTKRILEDTKAATKKEVKVINVVIAIILLCGVLFAALNIGNEKASQTLLDCFKILFTALIGILGFEANKK